MTAHGICGWLMGICAVLAVLAIRTGDTIGYAALAAAWALLWLMTRGE